MLDVAGELDELEELLQSLALLHEEDAAVEEQVPRQPAPPREPDRAQQGGPRQQPRPVPQQGGSPAGAGVHAAKDEIDELEELLASLSLLHDEDAAVEEQVPRQPAPPREPDRAQQGGPRQQPHPVPQQGGSPAGAGVHAAKQQSAPLRQPDRAQQGGPQQQLLPDSPTGAGAQVAKELRNQRQKGELREKKKKEQAHGEFKPSQDVIDDVENLLFMAQEYQPEGGYRKEEINEFINTWMAGSDDAPRGYARAMFSSFFGMESDVCQDGDQSLFGEVRAQQALAELKRARGAADARADADDFMSFSHNSMIYDEQGKSRDGSFHTRQLPFADLIRPQVFNILRHMGSFDTFATSELFMDDGNRAAFFFRASAKVPFLFTHHSCPAISARLMHKYLENPFNAAILASYEAGVNLKAALQAEGEAVKRTVHLADAYAQMRCEEPFLICVGPPRSKKSTLLNSLFGLHFETLQKGSAGLFHDAAEVLFSSNSFPIGFNIVDLQGAASEDVKLLELLLCCLPRSLLLIMLSDADYVDKVLAKLPECLRSRLEKRTLVLLRLPQKKACLQARLRVRKAFGPGVAMFDLGDDTVGEAHVAFQLQKALLQIQTFVGDKEDVLKQQHSDLLAESLQGKISQGDEEYTGWHGSFWLTMDQMSKRGHSGSFHIQALPNKFRERHMRMKLLLRRLLDGSPEKLERAEVFPCYSRHLELERIRRELEHREKYSEHRIKELEDKRAALESTTPEPSEIFNVFYQSYMETHANEYPDICADLVTLVEQAYLPRITDAHAQLKQAKHVIQQTSSKIGEARRKGGATGLTGEQLAKLQRIQAQLHEHQCRATANLNAAMEDLESKVLNSELFFREAKHCYGGDAKLVEKFGRDFEAGRPMEIIDGDTGKIEQEPLVSVFKWVHELRKNSGKLLVITVLGPQSSGKSTLLNYLFGAKFHVSAGRCTKGLNAMLLRTDFDEVKEVLVLDSEGIFSIEKQDTAYDRKLAIFCVSVSNVLLINIKGELSAEVQKVMEVAVYGVTKIVEAKAAVKAPKIMFLLRDQISGDKATMDAAYGKLRSQMREAAQASGMQLDDVVDMPEKSDDVLCLFHSALLPRRVNQSLELTESNPLFRDQCAKLRWRLLDSARSMRTEDKHDNLVSWIQDARRVWNAVQKQEQLSMSMDLIEIHNRSTLVAALGQFQTLMSMLLEKDCVPKEHPFLIHSLEAPDRFLPPGKTVFQELSCKVGEMLVKQSELRQAVDTRTEHAKEMQKLQREQEAQMGELRDRLADTQIGYAQQFARNFGPNLQRLAERSVRNIVDGIYQKVMTRWRRETVSIVVRDFAQDTREQLRMMVLTSKREGKQLSKADFAQEAVHLMKQVNPGLQRFLKSPTQVRDDAFRDLEESSRHSDSRKYFCFIQLRHVHNDLSPGPTILDADASSMAVETTMANECSRYFKLDWAKAERAVYDFVKRQPWNRIKRQWLRDLSEGATEHQTEGRAALSSLPPVGMPPERPVASSPAPPARETDADAGFGEELNTLQKHHARRATGILSAKLVEVAMSRLEALREKVQACARLAEEANSQSHSPQPFSEEARVQLFAVFNKELEELSKQGVSKWGNGRRKQVPVNVDKGERLEDSDELREVTKQCMMCDFDEYQQLFTRVYFNLLHRQAVRGERLEESRMQEKVTGETDAMLGLFDEMNRRAEGPRTLASAFVALLVGAVCAVLEDVFKADLKAALDSLTVDKPSVLQEARAAFEAADGSAEGQKTIVDFMRNPVALEERVCRRVYDERAEEQLTEQVRLYDACTARAVASIQDFFQGLSKALGLDSAQEQVSGVGRVGVDEGKERERNETVLHYLYWSVLWQFRDAGSPGDGSQESGQDKAKRMREKAESYRIWGGCARFPDVGRRLFKDDPKSYDTKADQARLSEISGLLKHADMDAFIISLSDIDGTSEEVRQKLSAARGKLLPALSSVVSAVASSSFEAVKSVAVGCRGVCDFCGARCSSATQCAVGCFHKSELHRPMAFMGSHTIQDGRKVLLRDFCTSPANIRSLWAPKGQGSADARRRLDFREHVVSVCLEWSTSAALELNVLCGCGTWHGHGTTGGSGGGCRCAACGMERGRSAGEGPEGRAAGASVCFKSSRSLVGKTLGVRVHNASDAGGRPHNPFKLGLFNQWGRQFFPNPGETAAQHEASWMFTRGPQTSSEARTHQFTAQDEMLGRESVAVTFPRHVTEMGGGWQFSEADAADRKTDPEFRKFIASCNEKWQIVKEQMCRDHQAELLDTVMDL